MQIPVQALVEAPHSITLTLQGNQLIDVMSRLSTEDLCAALKAAVANLEAQIAAQHVTDEAQPKENASQNKTMPINSMQLTQIQKLCAAVGTPMPDTSHMTQDEAQEFLNNFQSVELPPLDVAPGQSATQTVTQTLPDGTTLNITHTHTNTGEAETEDAAPEGTDGA